MFSRVTGDDCVLSVRSRVVLPRSLAADSAITDCGAHAPGGVRDNLMRLVEQRILGAPKGVLRSDCCSVRRTVAAASGGRGS